MKSYLSCYNYPTTVLCVDDDLNLLKSLKNVLELNNPVIAFYSPFEADAFLKKQIERPSGKVFSAEQVLDKDNIQLDLNMLHELIYDADRFKEISNIIIDYYMPGIDGLSFCRNFEGGSYKKIMLTGEADQALAVNAFNEGVINQFVMKGEPNAIETIKALVHKTQRQFFIEKSKFLIEFLISMDPLYFQYFTDTEFAEKLQKLLEEHDITEMYLFNQEGAYLLIDRTNQLWWMKVENTYSYQFLQQESESAFLQGPSPEAEKIYSLVKEGGKLPIFALFAERPIDIEDWNDILCEPAMIRTPQDTYHVLLTQDIGKAALRYQDIQFLDF